MVRLALMGWLVGALLGAACAAAPAPAAPPAEPVSETASPTAAPSPTPTALPSSTPMPTPTALPTATPTITPTPTPHPLQPFTIEGLLQRSYEGGPLEILSTQERNEAYTRYYVAYPSEGLRITGIVQVPHGRGPFPVVILNHGYIPPERYWSGADTWRVADYLARRGFVTAAPDFRGWGRSDPGPNFFRTGLVIDALNMIGSLASLPQADLERVGMWGHSMGGGVTTKAITLDARIKAAVLYAPVSAYDYRRWGGLRTLSDDPLVQAYVHASRNPAFLQQTSAIHHFERVRAPVQIHIGLADTVTPPRWSEAIRDALLEAGKAVEYFEYPGQGHAFQGDSWTLFLERYELVTSPMTSYSARRMSSAGMMCMCVCTGPAPRASGRTRLLL